MGGGFTTDFAFAVKDYYVPINMLNYSNDKITELAEKAAGEKDTDTRLKLYEEIVDIVFDECPDIPIFNKQIPWVWAKDLNAVPHMNSGRGYLAMAMVPPVADYLYTQVTGAVGTADKWAHTLETGLLGYSPDIEDRKSVV